LATSAGSARTLHPHPKAPGAIFSRHKNIPHHSCQTSTSAIAVGMVDRVTAATAAVTAGQVDGEPSGLSGRPGNRAAVFCADGIPRVSTVHVHPALLLYTYTT